MKMHCYFLLKVKHGASQLYLGGGMLQLSSAGTALDDTECYEQCELLLVLHTPEMQISLSLNALCCFVIFSVNE